MELTAIHKTGWVWDEEKLASNLVEERKRDNTDGGM